MSDYQPKEGDRVRVTLEGPVKRTYHDGTFRVGDDIDASNWIFPPAKHVVSVEKLADPEPEWKIGTVIKLPGFYPHLLTQRGWEGTGGRGGPTRTADITRAWKEGTLTVLYDPREDQ